MSVKKFYRRIDKLSIGAKALIKGGREANRQRLRGIERERGKAVKCIKQKELAKTQN